MRGVKRVVATCSLLLGGAVGWASGADALPCAEWVSTKINDEPGVGHLIGTETVTQRIAAEPGGVGASTEVTFEVGIYDFGGEAIAIDCRDYTRFR